MGFKDKVSKGLTAINVKTNNFMEQNKINTYIATLENEIRDLKQQIGGLCYDRWKISQFRIEDVEEMLKQIDRKSEEIEKQRELSEQLALQEKQILGTANGGGASAGTANVSQATVFCGQCGAQNGAHYKFCVKCGSPL